MAYTKLYFGRSANAGGPVLDTDGDFILDGGSYYVLPIFSGGGLSLAPRGDNPCSLLIGQEDSDVNKGIPVIFSNGRSRFGFVLESDNLNIEMDIKSTICVQSTYWRVAASDKDVRKFFVVAGPKPEPGEDWPKSFFQIKKTKYFRNGYTIGFCPNDNDCIDVGIFVDEYDVRHLTLSPTPYPVMFVKANGTETWSKTMSLLS